MSRIETAELEYVVTLADELSFTAAAERLGMAQPALSRAIARIERRLGVALFVRTTRTVCLSEAGDTFTLGARQLLADLDAVVLETRSRERDRPLSVALRPAAGSGVLARALDGWPGAAIRVEPNADPVTAVRAGLADLAIACATDDLSGLLVDEVGTEPTVLLVARGHPLTRARRLTLARVAATEGYQARCPLMSLDEIADRVAFSGMLVLATADAALRVGPQVRALTVADAAPMILCAVRRARAGHPQQTKFVRHLNACVPTAATG